MSPEVDLPQVRRLFDVFKANNRAMASYAPLPLDVRVLLLRPTQAAGRSRLFEDPSLGWRRLAAHVEVCRVPGDHFTMLRLPNVPEVATAIGTELLKT